MFYIGICDDEKGTCTELEELLYNYGKRKGLRYSALQFYFDTSIVSD